MNRSSDFVIAGMWNACNAAIITRIVALLTGYIAGNLTMQYNDCHIYSNHIPIIEKTGYLVRIPDRESPKLRLAVDPRDYINADVDTALQKLDANMFILEGYDPYPSIKFEMIA
jgi:thymidylate synthase